MMKFNQENDLWQRLMGENNPITQCRQLVEMSKLLLKKANLTQSETADYDRDDLTDLFLEY